ncbi:MAG: DUF5996 family protein [Pseudolabrys sp.]
MSASSPHDAWPELPLTAWQDTRDTLHLWTQIVGKIRTTQTPWLNHSWHVTLYVSARGLTTSVIPCGARSLEIEFDFIDHVLWLRSSDGQTRQVMLRPQTVAEFYAAVLMALHELGFALRIHPMPNEIANPIRFDQDRVHKAYDADHANRFWRILVRSHRVMAQFRTAFLGKASPVHFFWGSFDLAVTRFSGRKAPLHPGGVPYLPDDIVQEAYSHEVSSAGFWPGGGGGPIDYPAYYSYAYPAPDGCAAAGARPDAAFFSKELGEFLLPYDAVRTAADPDATLMAFLQSTYDAAADRADWNRAALECGIGRPDRPRPV